MTLMMPLDGLEEHLADLRNYSLMISSRGPEIAREAADRLESLRECHSVALRELARLLLERSNATNPLPVLPVTDSGSGLPSNSVDHA